MPTPEQPDDDLAPAPAPEVGIERWLRRTIVAAVLLLAAAYAASSLLWRPVHDVPLAIYSAFSYAEHGTRPYADLFEISFPGTLLAHLAIAAVFGYGDFGSMLANLLCLVAIGGATMWLLRPFGRTIGIGTAALFALAFLLHGPEMMLQRDYFLLVPVVIAAALHCHGRMRPHVRRFLIGFAVGLAVAVKPHAGIALLVLAGADIGSAVRARAGAAAVVRAVAAYAFGLTIPCAVVFVWLVAADGFSAWQEMSTRYLPLYLQMNRDHETMVGAARWIDRLRHLRELGAHWSWFAAAAVGALHAAAITAPTDPRARVLRILLALAVGFALYPAFSGQFWGYHYMPFLYFLCTLAGLCLLPCTNPSRLARLLPVTTLVFALFVHPNLVSSAKWLFRTQQVNGGQVDAMAAFLRERLQPGDTVQPLDWTAGAVHAMLIARARLATRFMYDYHFHHHVSEPFIQELRRRFLADFDAARPRFVIDWFGENKPWPSGVDTDRTFPELESRLEAGYAVAANGVSWRILERRR